MKLPALAGLVTVWVICGGIAAAAAVLAASPFHGALYIAVGVAVGLTVAIALGHLIERKTRP